MSESTDTSRHSLRAALAAAALLGRGSDSMLAHISPREAKMLKESGGSGARNPLTGLLEFDGGGDNYVGTPQPQYGPGSGSGLLGFSPTVTDQQGMGPGQLTASAPTDFTPVAQGADVPSYVSQYQSGPLGGIVSGYNLDPNSGTLGSFNVNGQTNYGWTFGNGLFAPAFLPTSGEIPSSGGVPQSALYPAALAGETLQDQSGLPGAFTDTGNVLTPTAQANADAAANLPGEVRAYADTGPDPWALLGLLGPAIAAGPVLGGIVGGLGAGAVGAGAAGAGAGAAADASGGIFDLGTLLGTSPAATTALATGDVSGLLGSAGAAAGAGAGAVGAAADAGSGAADLTALGLDPTTASLLGIGGDVGVPGFTAGGATGLADAGTAAGGLGLAPLSDNSGLFLGATDSSPAATAGLTTPTAAAPSDLGAAGSGFVDTNAFDVPAAGAGSDSGGFLSSITDPINSFAKNNAGLLKILGIGASGLSLGADLLKGNSGPTALTGGSQLNTLAGQLATPGGLNPTQTANLNNLEGTAQTVNQGQVQNLTNLQGQAQQSGATLQSYLTSGTLPPAVQSAVDQATNAAVTNIKAGYAARGIPANSSMEIQDINNAKQNAVTTAAGLMQQLSTQGLSEQQLAATIGGQITGANTQSTQLASQIASQLVSSGLTSAGISEQIYQALLQADQQQQTQTGQAIASLAAALAGGTTIKLGT